MKYPKRIQRLLDKPREKLTKSEGEYLVWYGAIGPGEQLRKMCKEVRRESNNVER